MKMMLTIALFIGFFTAVNAQKVKTLVNASKRGLASFYHPKFEGRRTATGEVFANAGFTAASNRISLNSYVKVTNLSNGRVLYAKINDRMAGSSKRLVDLTQAGAESLGYRSAGTTQVKMELVTEEEGLHGILAQRDITGKKKNTL